MGPANAGRAIVWIRVAAALAVFGLFIAAWKRWPGTPLNPQELAAWLAPYRDAWFALPAVMLAFVALGLVMVPVMLLIAATGIAFGPLLGPVYAMAGCLASASAGFAIGRRFGRRRVERLGGDRILRFVQGLRRNGTLAVFLIRKVPAPFTLVNIIVGASTIRYRDFVFGTLLGMVAIVVALAGFGSQLIEIVRDPSPDRLVKAAMFVGVPLTLAWLLNRTLREPRPAA